MGWRHHVSVRGARPITHGSMAGQQANGAGDGGRRQVVGVVGEWEKILAVDVDVREPCAHFEWLGLE